MIEEQVKLVHGTAVMFCVIQYLQCRIVKTSIR